MGRISKWHQHTYKHIVGSTLTKLDWLPCTFLSIQWRCSWPHCHWTQLVGGLLSFCLAYEWGWMVGVMETWPLASLNYWVLQIFLPLSCGWVWPHSSLNKRTTELARMTDTHLGGFWLWILDFQAHIDRMRTRQWCIQLSKRVDMSSLCYWQCNINKLDKNDKQRSTMYLKDSKDELLKEEKMWALYIQHLNGFQKIYESTWKLKKILWVNLCWVTHAYY